MKISPEQFDSLALEHLDMLYRLARRWTGDPAAAEDLVQETYLRAFRARSDFSLEKCGIRPWLVRIMHNVYITAGQREQRQPPTMEEAHLNLTAAHELTGWTNDPAGFQAMDQRLVRAIDELAEEYRSVLLLWALEDFSYQEIADAVQVPIGTVMSRLHRARARLSDRLAEFARSEGIIRE